MYATRARRVKTDKRDARTLAEALRLGAYRVAYRVAHRISAARRHVRAGLAVREALVRTRTRYIALAKALVRRDGLRVASSEAHLVAKRIAALELSDTLAAELLPLFHVLAPINEQIADADSRIATLAQHDAAMALLASAPAIGPITASAVVATVDDVTRFRSAHQFEAFLGLVPGERSSGEKRRVGRITKAGNSRASTSSWRRRGASSARRATTRPRCARGRSTSPRGVASASRWWPSRVACPGSCSRCGWRGSRTMRHGFACPARALRRRADGTFDRAGSRRLNRER